jgi:para-nitrobenzyl esterase
MAAILGRAPARGVVRKTQYGPVEGVDEAARSGTLCWLGVPFAKPPVGELRWKAPVDAEAWTSLRPAKSFAKSAVQYGTLIGPGANNAFDSTVPDMLNKVVGSEDCLYLNVWRPASSEANLPAIVFIHGGYNLAGYTADPLYNGANLSRVANCVVVTVGYRLGVFGWFRLAQLQTGDADDDSGNFGTLDHVKALQWVNRNIEEFGGNAANVTVMGHSAGALNTWVLLTVPPIQNAGLFQRIVPLSGGVSLASNLPAGSFPFLLPASYYEAQAGALLQNLLIADGKASDGASASAFIATQSRAQVADYLRGKSALAIVTSVLTQLTPLGLGLSGPIPEGRVVAEDPIAAIAAGNYAQVPVLAGITNEEAKTLSQFLAVSAALGGVPGLKVTDATRFKMLQDFDADGTTTLTAASLINPQYLPVDAPRTGFNARTDLLGRVLFGANRDNVLDALKSQQSTLWHYQFNWAQEPPPWNDVFGAAHLLDVPFVFGNFGPSLYAKAIGGNANQAGRLALSAAMMASIAAFARTGDPNNALLGTAWPVWPTILLFDASLDDKAIAVRGHHALG